MAVKLPTVDELYVNVTVAGTPMVPPDIFNVKLVRSATPLSVRLEVGEGEGDGKLIVTPGLPETATVIGAAKVGVRSPPFPEFIGAGEGAASKAIGLNEEFGMLEQALTFEAVTCAGIALRMRLITEFVDAIVMGAETAVLSCAPLPFAPAVAVTVNVTPLP